MEASDFKTLLFMHQMKTGGVTLTQILRDQYPQKKIYKIDGRRYRESNRDFINLPDRQREKFQVIAGHMFFGLHKTVRNPAVYITMLRHPFSRILSLYYYQLRPQQKYHVSPETSLIDYLEKGVALNADNGMTRCIAGKDAAEVPYGLCTKEMLLEAKENIKKHFLVIGLTERFDESLVLFKRLLKWEKIPKYQIKNLNLQKPKHVKLTDKELSTITKYNVFDLELYSYSEKIFEELVARHNSHFQTFAGRVV